ncbi:hypothetical protein GHK86_18880, partial [Acidimicrobiaceae bacterium USS-CC1]|nr:hypothetical protein [Acidiferrimicrobium australe]
MATFTAALLRVVRSVPAFQSRGKPPRYSRRGPAPARGGAACGLRISDGHRPLLWPVRTLVVIGCGPWGLCVLERLLSRARAQRASVAIHVVEAGRPGTGVYQTDQPDYLVLNNPCGQLSLYARPEADRDPPYGLGLFEWARRRGYGWVGDECRVGGRGRPVEPTDFLPRRLMGEYLQWFYETLVADAPAGVAVIHHPTPAVDVVAIGDRELVVLGDGSSVAADRVVLTSGHTPNLPA